MRKKKQMESFFSAFTNYQKRCRRMLEKGKRRLRASAAGYAARGMSEGLRSGEEKTAVSTPVKRYQQCLDIGVGKGMKG